MNILADKQKKMRESDLSADEQERQYDDFVQCYHKLRDMLATLKYEIRDTEHIKRAELRGDEWNRYLEKRFSEWSGFDINYINDMTYKPKGVTASNEAFAFYKRLIPCRENGFLLRALYK